MVGGSDNDRLHGNEGDDLIGGQDGDDFIDGGAGNDSIYGDAGNDRLVGGLGDDRIDGGAGLDVAVFSGARSSYVITTSNGVTTVAGQDGTDTLFGIERLEFADGLVDAAPMPDAWVV
jgi:Ca2+-binding RTX toxin-like protein